MSSSGSADVEPLRVIVDEKPADGAWNMAVDAVLLESALMLERCTLRWYRWRTPTLSLGHFQRADDALVDDRFAVLPRVRRLSGGGAILHDRELTYSCAIPPGHPLANRPSELYQRLHAAIVGILSQVGADVVPRGTPDRQLDASFLCFSRSDANDLVIGQHKILGSAQRRRRGAILQHGALLLERSPLAPEFAGLYDLCDITVTPATLLPQLVSATAAELASATEVAQLSDEEQRRVAQLVSSASLD